jgi:hypothetical protein
VMTHPLQSRNPKVESRLPTNAHKQKVTRTHQKNTNLVPLEKDTGACSLMFSVRISRNYLLDECFQLAMWNTQIRHGCRLVISSLSYLPRASDA